MAKRTERHLKVVETKPKEHTSQNPTRRYKSGLDERIINPENYFDLKPLSQRQADFIDSYNRGQNIVAYGSSGTGKSMVALALALKDVVINKTFKQIILIRSPLSVNHQGHLPGTLEEKEMVYERPYVDIVNFIFDHNEAYQELKQANIINFMTTSYIRGLTWDDSVIIADEVQNMLWEEVNTIATRCGRNSRIMFLGDLKQDDLSVAKRNQHSGMLDMLKVAKSMEEFDLIEFAPDDIVRDRFVKSWILACEYNKV